jgi:phage FluMu protein Com
MPITARCAGCGQILSVQDQFAGMQGKCPTCGTIVTFTADAPTILPGAPRPVLASSPEVLGPPRPFSLAGLDQLASITMPSGLFCLLLAALSTLLPWSHQGPISFSGVGRGDATLLLFLCLLVGGIIGTTFFFKDNLRPSAILGAAFGTFAFLVMLSEVTHQGGSAGPVVGLIAALGILGAFGSLAILRPLEWPFLKTLNLPPLLQSHGALLLGQAVAVVLGMLYLVLTVT